MVKYLILVLVIGCAEAPVAEPTATNDPAPVTVTTAQTSAPAPAPVPAPTSTTAPAPTSTTAPAPDLASLKANCPFASAVQMFCSGLPTDAKYITQFDACVAAICAGATSSTGCAEEPSCTS